MRLSSGPRVPDDTSLNSGKGEGGDGGPGEGEGLRGACPDPGRPGEGGT